MDSRLLPVALLGLSASCNAAYLPNYVNKVHVKLERQARNYPTYPTDTPPPLAPPLTTFPPPTVVSLSEATSVTTNTHINIGGTEVPVLHGCAFCPPGPDCGLALIGIPDVPGVYPPPENP